MRRRLLLLALLCLAPAQAQAAWMVSSSPHFVVYADTNEKNLRRFSQQLERYDAAMAVITGLKRDVPSPSNRVTVYLVGSEDKVRKLYGLANSKYIGGFYVPRAGGSIAIIPTVDTSSSGEADLSMIVLLHEYAHHFLISGSSFPSPKWLGEGAAEFFASASFSSEGGVGLGRPANHRAAELVYARDVTVLDLLDPDAYEKRRGKSKEYDAFYGKSWLLYHYLVFEPTRNGQLAAYAKGLMAGKSSLEAGRAAFGDLDKLEKELDKYELRPRLYAFNLKPAALIIGQIDTRILSAGEAAILPVKIRSRRGVSDDAMAKAILAEARAVAAKYPKDPAVLSELAEALVDSNLDDEAIATANAALALDPNNVDVLLQKGLAMFAKAEEADDRAKAYRAAREPFLAVNAIEHDHPLPLMYYYLSFVRAGIKPTANAVAGLERATALAPFDLGLRMMTAIQCLRDGKRDEARAYLLPVAYNPHGEGAAAKAREMITRIDADPKWTGADLGLGIEDTDAAD